MKNLLLVFPILFLVNFCFGQSTLVIAPNLYDTSFVDLDISDYSKSIQLKSFLSNDSDSDTLEIFWVRKLDMDCQENWQFITSDKLISYGVMEDSCLYPFMLYPNEEDVLFSIALLPRSTQGCCQPKIFFYSTKEPNVPIDSIQYSIKVNDATCVNNTTSANQLPQNNLSIQCIPNPVHNSFFVKTNSKINWLSIHNSLGQIVKTIEVGSGEEINIENLNSGVYFVNCFLNQKKIGTSKILKK